MKKSDFGEGAKYAILNYDPLQGLIMHQQWKFILFNDPYQLGKFLDLPRPKIDFVAKLIYWVSVRASSYGSNYICSEPDASFT